MIFKKINRAVPEQVFVAVRNVDTATLTQGYCAVWDYDTDDQDYAGYAVRFPVTNSTALMDNPCMFAGVIASDISPDSNGTVQVWGMVDSVFVSGTIVNSLFAGATTNWNKLSMYSRVLRPVNVYHSNSAATGVAGVMTQATQAPVALGVAYLNGVGNGGYMVPMSMMYTTVSTDGTYVTGTLTTTSSGFCKAFIRAL
jgi:hypothetical protein